MRLFTYRGWRVRKYYQKIKVITYSIMLLPFYLVMLTIPTSPIKRY